MSAQRFYREQAEALIRAAAETTGESRRQVFLDLAVHWHGLAVKAEMDEDAARADTEGA